MKYFSYLQLAKRLELCHAVFSRSHGVSKAPFHSCNISLAVGDDPHDVLANRQMIKKALGLQSLISARQIHHDEIFSVDDKPVGDQEMDGYDALITNLTGIGLMIQQADCQAIMLFDPVLRVIANVHSGWRGSVCNIIGKTISRMANDFGSDPRDLLAGISPSIGPCCAEFVNFQTELPKELHHYQQRANYFDFWAMSRDQLIAAGLERQNIEVAGICTKCDHDYFSYRREGKTGRFASVIAFSSDS